MRSVIAVLFSSDKSRFVSPGPRNVLRCKFPYVATGQPLTIAEQTAGNISVMGGCYPCQIQVAALLYQAMSLFRQGKHTEARRLFSQAEAQMPPLPKDESKPFLDGKPAGLNYLICWLAYKEARALIMEGPPAPVAKLTGPK